MSFERVEIGDAILYRGDCLEILPTLNRVDAVITDPPYGIDIAAASTVGATGRNGKGCAVGKSQATTYRVSDWDKSGMSSEQWDVIRRFADRFVVWGGNHLADVMGSSAGVLVWDKKCQNGWNDTFSEMEIAFTNVYTRAKGFRHLWAGALRASETSANVRQHPTQKPIALMVWCIEQAGNPQSIADPFMGSGTTGVAALQLGRKFIGIERDERYFAIACERIANAQRQQTLFEPAPVMQQESLI